MRDHPRYDRGFRDAGRSRGPRGYGGDFRRGYDRGRERSYPPSFAGASFPMAPGYAPMTWGWYGPFGMGMGVDPFPYGPPMGPPGWGVPERPPRRPEESPAYGRGGDRELRRWARDRGYDVGYTIYPRETRGHR